MEGNQPDEFRELLGQLENGPNGGMEPSDEAHELLRITERLRREGEALRAIGSRPNEAAFLAQLYAAESSSRPRRWPLALARLGVLSRSMAVGGIVFVGITAGAAAFTGDPLGISNSIPFIGNTQRVPDIEQEVPGRGRPDSSPSQSGNENPLAAPQIDEAPARGVGVGQGETPPGQGGENPGNGGGSGAGVGQGETPPGQGGENPGNGGGSGAGVGQGETPPGQGGENPDNSGGNANGAGQGETPPGQGSESPGNGNQP